MMTSLEIRYDLPAKLYSSLVLVNLNNAGPVCSVKFTSPIKQIKLII